MASRILMDSTGKFDFDLPGVTVENWTHNPAFALAPGDFVLRPGRDVTSAVIHNTQGYWPQLIVDDPAPVGQRAENVVNIWRRDARSASTPIVTDTDGSVVQAHYLMPVVAWHAKDASPRSVGFEIVQVTPGNKLFRASIVTVARIIHGMVQSGHPKCHLLNPADGTHPLPWLEIRTSYPGGGRPPRVPVEQRGVFGHRDVRPMDRGRGDPGDAPMAIIAEVLESLCGSGVVRYSVTRT